MAHYGKADSRQMMLREGVSVLRQALLGQEKMLFVGSKILIKANVLFVLLAGSTLAIPDQEPTSSHNTGRTLKRTVDGKTARIHEYAAKQIATAGKDINKKSSCPHILENYDNIQWNNNACNPDKVRTIGSPIDEIGRLYPWIGVWIGDKALETQRRVMHLSIIQTTLRTGADVMAIAVLSVLTYEKNEQGQESYRRHTNI
ncbi:hypothetical protein N7466_006827 [Penicillium verhagenii]|uniref:uncharacterized protein n=1 Tax=Penicillium verhagenii TaxID=1562060 RepID=UPI002545A137|nr:uncharacterized protein N7466_006827 [Penicillium verhagenii]KAJ5927871.1 hypothetical protein N7466_006827 [Penicillium verhagenii]